MTLNMPTDAFVNVTSRCNARCIMCDNWRKPPIEELPAEAFSKLPKLRYVNVSGGEPSMRDDLPEVIEVIDKSCGRPKIDITTNGFLTAGIEKSMRQILKQKARVGVRVSIDGIEGRHDEVRGVEGTFNKAMDTVQVLKQIGLKDVALAYTMTNSNVDQLVPVMELAKKLGVGFTVCGTAHNSELTFATNNNPIENLDELKHQFDYVVKKHLRSFDPRNWVRCYVESGNYFYAVHGSRTIPCFAGTDFFFMQPNGDIYPCMILDYKLGNITTSSFREIWTSEKASKFRDRIADVSNCASQCWMLCTVFPHIRRNKLSFIQWLITSKVKAHLGLPVTPVQC